MKTPFVGLSWSGAMSHRSSRRQGGVATELDAVARTAVGVDVDAIFVRDRAGELDALVALGYLAQRTDRQLLGAVAATLEHRSPGVFAKQLTALDLVSGGRGLGVVQCPTAGDGRNGAVVARRVEEYLAVVRSVLDGERGPAGGSIYRIEGAINEPRVTRDEPMAIGLWISSETVVPPLDRVDFVVVDGRSLEASKWCQRLISEGIVVVVSTTDDVEIATRCEHFARAGCRGVIIEWDRTEPSFERIATARSIFAR